MKLMHMFQSKVCYRIKILMSVIYLEKFLRFLWELLIFVFHSSSGMFFVSKNSEKVKKRWYNQPKKKTPVIFYLFCKTCFLSDIRYMNELKYLILISQNNTWQLWNCTSSIQVADWWHQTLGSISWCGL